MVLPELVIVGDRILYAWILFFPSFLRTQKPYQVKERFTDNNGIFAPLGEFHCLLIIGFRRVPLLLSLENIAFEIEGHVHDVAIGKLTFEPVQFHQRRVELIFRKMTVRAVVKGKWKIDILPRVRILGKEHIEKLGRFSPVLQSG